MRNVMSWAKVLTINLIILILIIIFIEVGAGVGRIAIGKQYLFPQVLKANPCEEMKTDALLTHIHNHRSLCQIKGGYADGEYVRYNISNSKKPVLLTLGGSTADGFFQHLSAGDTYTKYLAEFLAKDFQIMSGGVGAYSSLQELYKVIRDAPRIDNLHTVISLNGINETPDYHGFNEFRKVEFPFLTYIQVQMNQQQIWIDQRIQKNTLKSIFPNLSSLFLFFNRKPLLENLESNSSLQNPKIIDAPDRWLLNVQRMHDVLRSQGVRYYVFLQPTMGLEGVQSEPEKDSKDEALFELLQESYIEEIRNLYSDLKRYCANLSYCFDISNMVPPTGNMYKDPRHHNSNGNKLLAEIVANTILEQDTVDPK